MSWQSGLWSRGAAVHRGIVAYRPVVRSALVEDREQVAAFDLLHGTDGHALDFARLGGGDSGFHFHGFDGGDGGAGGDGFAFGDGEGDDAGEGGGDVVGVGAVGFFGDREVGGDGAVADLDGAELAVEVGHDVADAAFVGFADGFELNEQGDALVQGDRVLLAGF